MYKHQTSLQGRCRGKMIDRTQVVLCLCSFSEVQLRYLTSVYTETSTWTLSSIHCIQSRSVNKRNELEQNHLHKEKRQQQCKLFFCSVPRLPQTWVFPRILDPVLCPKWIKSHRQSVNKHALQTYVVTTIWSSLTTSTTFSSSGSSSDWCPVPSWVGFSRKLCTKFWISPRASVTNKTGEMKSNNYLENLL